MGPNPPDAFAPDKPPTGSDGKPTHDVVTMTTPVWLVTCKCGNDVVILQSQAGVEHCCQVCERMVVVMRDGKVNVTGDDKRPSMWDRRFRALARTKDACLARQEPTVQQKIDDLLRKGGDHAV